MTGRFPLPRWAELPLVAVSVATVAGFIRVYGSWDFLGPLLGFALGAHLLAITTRRFRASTVIVVAVAVSGAALAVAWILFPSTTAFGLPTGATWTAAAEALEVARERYPVVVAPTEPLAGFQLAAGLALWLAAWFGDWTAHRLRATAEAVAPTTAIFLFCAVLGSGADQVACAAAFAAAVLAFVGVQRSLAIEREHAWLPTNRATARAVLRAAGALAAVAVIAGVAVGPRLPGADGEAALSWRGGSTGDGSRVTISPMVELKKRLVEQSNREVFRVRSTEPAYWRLTSLDAFDGQIWSSSGEFDKAEGALPSEAPTSARSNSITQQVTIEDLSTIWAPTAFEAASLAGSDTPLRWDPDSSTLIVGSSTPTSDGLRYTVVSKVPAPTTRTLASSPSRDPKAITDRYLGLPADFPFFAGDLARSVTSASPTRYAKARALQDWFRTEFDYSLDIPEGHGDDALVAFLKSGKGYCEQFAGAFAAMARSLGIPARVAVGFTPGNTNEDDPDLYRVYGRHAHAWPEVYFPGTGWVAFEPTPGRGMPGTEGYTGVAAQQDDARPVTITTTSTTAATTIASTRPADRTESTRPVNPERSSASAATTTAADQDPSPWAPARPLAIGAAAAALLAALAFVRRRRQRAHRLAELSSAEQTWARVGALLARHRHLEQRPAETHLEFAARCAATLDDGSAMLRLAELVSAARWSPDGLAPDEVAELDALGDQLEAELRAKVPVA